MQFDMRIRIWWLLAIHCISWLAQGANEDPSPFHQLPADVRRKILSSRHVDDMSTLLALDTKTRHLALMDLCQLAMGPERYPTDFPEKLRNWARTSEFLLHQLLFRHECVQPFDEKVQRLNGGVYFYKLSVMDTAIAFRNAEFIEMMIRAFVRPWMEADELQFIPIDYQLLREMVVRKNANAPSRVRLLLAAIDHDCFPLVYVLLKLNVDPSLIHPAFHSNAIHRSAERGRVRILRLLSTSNPQQVLPHLLLRQTDEHGMTALHLAARYGHYAILEFITACLGPVVLLSTDNHQRLPLHVAIESQHLVAISFLLDQMPPSTLLLPGPQGRTAIHLLALNGHFIIAHELLNRALPALLMLPDIHGQTALHLCVLTKNRHILSLLVAKIPLSQFNIQNLDGMTALQLADSRGDITSASIIATAYGRRHAALLAHS